MEWMPIETAPKDGGTIIGWDGKDVQPFRWIDDDSPYEPGPFTGWAYADFDWGGVLYEGYNEAHRALTHWMPLPDPPE